MPNSVDPDETAHYEPSHLDLHCLQSYLYWSAGMKGLRKKKSLSGQPIHYVNKSTEYIALCSPTIHDENEQLVIHYICNLPFLKLYFNLLTFLSSFCIA